jgi:hypothetical protein
MESKTVSNSSALLNCPKCEPQLSADQSHESGRALFTWCWAVSIDRCGACRLCFQPFPRINLPAWRGVASDDLRDQDFVVSQPS